MIVAGRLNRSMSIAAATISSATVAVLVTLTWALIEVGPFSSHMLGHIVTMSIVAPLLAGGLARAGLLPKGVGSATALWSATFVQMAVLWAWHGPAIQHLVHASASRAFVLHAALLAAAMVFWCAVIASGERPWQTILALLFSGKLACFLGALLVFAPRLLIHTTEGRGVVHSADAISDQHLAGLIMLAACPLSYILAAIVITAREISSLQRQLGGTHRHGSSIGC